MVFKINKPADVVFAYLSDMQKFVSVHPVISKMEATGENKYLVFETLKFGLIPFSFTYPAILSYNEKERTVNMSAIVMKLTHIDMAYKIRTEGGQTLIEEVISFRSLLPLKPLMTRVFKKQHEQLFRNIERAA